MEIECFFTLSCLQSAHAIKYFGIFSSYNNSCWCKNKSVPRKEKQLPAGVGFAVLAPVEAHCFLPGHCCCTICAGVEAHQGAAGSQQMALRSCICSRSCFDKSFEVQKSIVQELELTRSQNGACSCSCFQVICFLVAHNSLMQLVLFVTAKNKPSLVHPLLAAGREAQLCIGSVIVLTAGSVPPLLRDVNYGGSSFSCGHQGSQMLCDCFVCTASCSECFHS